MPAIVAQAQLDENEIAVLKAAIDGQALEELLKTLRKRFNQHRDVITAAVRNGTLTSDEATAACDAITTRLRLLHQLQLDGTEPIVEAHHHAESILSHIYDELHA